MKKDNSQDKSEVLAHIANGKTCSKAVGQGVAKWQIGDAIVHIRHCSNANPDGVTYVFNINRNTLKADYEIWICGKAATYYLVPMDVVKEMYTSPDGYPDHTHSAQGIRIIHVNTSTHAVKYGSGQSQDCSAYYRAQL